MKKVFVLDTNVILHDHKSVYNFEDNDIVIPIIVLEELDHFKKGTDLINFQAREFMRELDKISGKNFFSKGISLGQDKGTLYIETGKPFPKEMLESFSETSVDNRIIAVAWDLKHSHPNKPVVLVSQDINVRMKAKALGIAAEDYESGKVADVEAFYKAIVTYENVDEKIIERIYADQFGVPVIELPFAKDLIAHQYLILKGTGSVSVLAHYNPIDKTIDRVNKQRSYGIDPRNAEQTFALDALLRPDIKLVTLTGKAGTGKTLLALAAALQQRQEFEQILLARPIIALANRDMGFLPGDAKEKIEPYMQPLYDNLSIIKHKFSVTSTEYKRIDEMVKNEQLVITPLAYIRGRSLANIFFIIDEAQNLTPHEVKTIITRAGEGTKLVFTGDLQQIDSPYLDAKSNGLSYVTDKMKGQDIFAHINLMKGERSYLADLASELL